MKNSSVLFLSFILFLTACFNNNKNIGGRLLADPEQHIKDSPDILLHDSTILYTGWYYVVDTVNCFMRHLYKSPADTFFINPKPIVLAENFTTLQIYESNAGGQKYIGLTMQLDKAGAKNWSIATQKSIGKQLAFILDNQLLQVVKVNSQITSGITALNSGVYSRTELENFKKWIESER